MWKYYFAFSTSSWELDLKDVAGGLSVATGFTVIAPVEVSTSSISAFLLRPHRSTATFVCIPAGLPRNLQNTRHPHLRASLKLIYGID